MSKSPFKVTSKGNYKHTVRFLTKLLNGDFYKILEYYAQAGVDNLRDHTPINSGLARDSWYYDIQITNDKASITWLNSDIENGENVIILLEYGHATRFGGYVEGIDIVDPALRPMFEAMIDAVWKEVMAG